MKFYELSPLLINKNLQQENCFLNKHCIKKVLIRGLVNVQSRLEVIAVLVLNYFINFFSLGNYLISTSKKCFVDTRIVQPLSNTNRWSDKKNKIFRRYPPNRRYVLISYHKDDTVIAKELFITLYLCLEPFICRPVLLDFDLPNHIISRQIECCDIFIPLITSSYQNCFNKSINFQLRKALSLCDKKGSFWIVPFIRVGVFDPILLETINRYLSFVCFEPESILSRYKDVSSLFRMIMEIGRVKV